MTLPRHDTVALSPETGRWSEMLKYTSSVLHTPYYIETPEARLFLRSPAAKLARTSAAHGLPRLPCGVRLIKSSSRQS